MAKTSFHLNNKKILLTYPQLNEEQSAQDLLEHFKWKFQRLIHFTYIICCREKHQEAGIHYHIYFECDPACRTTQQRFFDLDFNGNVYHPNIEVVKTTPWKTVEYVMKDGDYYEYMRENRPKCTFNSMSKTEKNKFLREHDPIEMYDEGLLSPQQCANILKAKQVIAQSRIATLKRREPPFVLWFWGKTGTGKTRTAVEMAKDMGVDYWISHSEKLNWFDGYNGQPYVIIDDFRRDMCTLKYLLRLTDRYEMQVQVKGGYVNWIPKYIIFTCPVDHKTAFTYYDTRTNEEREWDNLDQLTRRINDEICFDNMEPYTGRALIDMGELRDETL